MEKSKKEVDECHQKILYLEAYSRRENLKFEGIVELSHKHATSTRSENTEDVLVGFLENVLGIENAKNIEFQRIRRLGKPKNDSGDGGRTIIYCTFPEILGQRANTQARAQTKGTNYRMFEDIPKELHQKRKLQMGRLKEARKEDRRANFSKSEPDKLYTDGKYVKL